MAITQFTKPRKNRENLAHAYNITDKKYTARQKANMYMKAKYGFSTERSAKYFKGLI